MSKLKVGDKIRCFEDNGDFHIGEIKEILNDGYVMEWNHYVNRQDLSNVETLHNSKDFIEDDCELINGYNTPLWRKLHG